jgi:hypothetical protein
LDNIIIIINIAEIRAKQEGWEVGASEAEQGGEQAMNELGRTGWSHHGGRETGSDSKVSKSEQGERMH